MEQAVRKINIKRQESFHSKSPFPERTIAQIKSSRCLWQRELFSVTYYCGVEVGVGVEVDVVVGITMPVVAVAVGVGPGVCVWVAVGALAVKQWEWELQLQAQAYLWGSAWRWALNRTHCK